jgi:transposase
LFDNVISRAHHWTAEVLVKGEARAARLVREERDDYDSEWAATKGHLEPAGDNPETLRAWNSRAEVDPGDPPGVSIEEPSCG